MKSPLKFVVGIIVCGLLLVFIVSIFSYRLSTKTILYSAQIDWLPASAKDVSHEKITGFGNVEMIECSIPEADFLALAQARNWNLQQLKDFGAFMRIQSLPRLRHVEGLGDTDVILTGYRYESRRPNGGGITVCYDSDLKRMIYQTSNR
jgi:hypothetical protein